MPTCRDESHQGPGLRRRQRRRFLKKKIEIKNKGGSDINQTVVKPPTINRNTDEIANLLNLGTSQADWTEIPKDEVVVGALSLQFITVAN